MYIKRQTNLPQLEYTERCRQLKLGQVPTAILSLQQRCCSDHQTLHLILWSGAKRFLNTLVILKPKRVACWTIGLELISSRLGFSLFNVEF